MTWKKLLAREGVDLATISGIDLVFYEHIWEFSKKKEELFFTLLDGKNFTHFIGTDPQELGRYLYIKFFNSQEQIKDHYKSGNALLEEIKKSVNKWKKKLNNSSAKKEVLEAYNEFRKQFMVINHIYSITSWLAIEAWQNDFEKVLSSLIKRNKLEKRQEEILGATHRPWKETAVYEIQKKVKEGVDSASITRDFQFLRSWSIIWYRPIDEAWVKNIGEAKTKDKHDLFIEDVIEMVKPNKEERHFLEMAPYIIFFKDWRDDLRRKQAYYWSFFFEMLASKFKLDHDDLGYLSLDEIEWCIENNSAVKDKIVRRKSRPFIITVNDKKLEIKVIDELPEKYEKIIDDIEESEKKLSIKGLVAQKGKVKGKVVIIRSYHDIKKVNEGDILVANTTHPTYLPAMQKAAAFVTNEGGIASHAAIVARELKKPCIVGTKVATKVLLDGDMVEVDADKGIVRKID